MKHFTLTLTEDELMYIRTALCDKNLKHTVKYHQCQKSGDKTGEEYNLQRHEVGHNILANIDAMRD